MADSTYTEEQPQDGDCVLHCAHMDSKPIHFFKCVPFRSFKRPDGTRGEAHWMAVCDFCIKRYRGNPDPSITGDSSWIGNEPAIKTGLQ